MPLEFTYYTHRPTPPHDRMMRPHQIDAAIGTAVGVLCTHDLNREDWPPHNADSLLLEMANSIVHLTRHAEAQAEILRGKLPKPNKSSGERAWHIPPPPEPELAGPAKA